MDSVLDAGGLREDSGQAKPIVLIVVASKEGPRLAVLKRMWMYNMAHTKTRLASTCQDLGY